MLKKLTSNLLSSPTSCTTTTSTIGAAATSSTVKASNIFITTSSINNLFIHYNNNSKIQKKAFSSSLNLSDTNNNNSNQQQQQQNNRILSTSSTTLSTTTTSKNCTTKKYIDESKLVKKSTLNTRLNTSVKNFIRNSPSIHDNDKRIKKQKSTDLKSLSLKLHEPLFGNESVGNVSKQIEYSRIIRERILKLYQNYKPYQYVELTRYLLYLNQVQYIPDVITMANKNRNVISHYSFAKELAYQLERKGKHIHSHPNEYQGIDTKLILNQCAKCLDLMISSGYKAVQTTNTDIFIDMLCYRIKMYEHTNDFKGLKKLFENQLKPLTTRFLTHPIVLCKLYNVLGYVLIEMNELNYLYEQVYSKNINNHFNIVKLVQKGISGTPLFVTVTELLSKSSISHTNTASKMCLLGVEYLELAKREQDEEFIRKLGGIISKSYGDLFDVDKNNLLPLENYFSFYLNFISYYWNLYSDILDKKVLKYISIRFLYLYARLVHDSAYDVSSSREAEYVHQVLIENQIPLTNDVFHCLLVIYAHTGKQKLCENLFNTITMNNTSNNNTNEMVDISKIGGLVNDNQRTIYQSMVNAYSIMGNFEKALYYATQVKMNIEVLNALLKSVATLCLPNMRNLNDEDYILSCLQKTLQLFADHSIQYDGITLNTLINIYGLLGKLPYMIKHFQMLVDDGNFKEYINAITFTTVIRHLCTNDHFDSALDMFNRMKELNIKPTRVTYKVLLEGMILTGKDCLPMIMQNMKYDNISMDDHLVGSIVLYYASRTRNEQQLMDILSVVDRHKSEYTPKVYEHLVLFYCKINNFSRARYLVYEMLERGVTPTMRTFSHFITFLHTHMDSFDLLHILLPIEQDIVNYITQRKKGELTSLCNTIFDGKDLGIGLSLLQIMLQKVDFDQLQTKIEHLSRDHYLNKNVSYILSGLIKTDPNTNVKDFIDNLIYLFESCGCSPFASTNALFLHVISELKGQYEMKQFYLEMKRNNLILDIRSYNLYLEALLNTEGPNVMWKYFNTQTSESVKINPDIDTLHILIRAIRDYNDMEFILSKYRQFIDSTRYLSPKLSKQKTSKNSPQLKEEIISSILDAIESKEILISQTSSSAAAQNTTSRIEQMKDYLQKALFSFIE